MVRQEFVEGYGRIFKRDYRMFSVPNGKGGRTPLPWRNGLALRSVGYFFGTLIGLALWAKLPVLGLPVDLLPGSFRFVLLPVLVSMALTYLEPHGQTPIQFLWTMVTHRLSPRDHSAGMTIRPEGEVAILSAVTAIAVDPGDVALKACCIVGPATVRFREPLELTPVKRRPGCFTARPCGVSRRDGGGGALTDLVELETGERLRVRP